MTNCNTLCYGSNMAPILNWKNLSDIGPESYVCGYCGNVVSSSNGYSAGIGTLGYLGKIRICSHCFEPTYFQKIEKCIPGDRPGVNIAGITDAGVSTLYNEARDAAACGAYTSSVMVCRTILMHIAVEQGAEKGLKFIQYVDFLADKGYVPPNGKAWVDFIRSKGNEATHEICLMTKADAEKIIKFVEMLLRFIYEFPSMLTK